MLILLLCLLKAKSASTVKCFVLILDLKLYLKPLDDSLISSFLNSTWERFLKIFQMSVTIRNYYEQSKEYY